MNIIETNLNWNGELYNSNCTNYIILHHAEASECNVYDIHQWHLNNGWCGIGYHYFIRKDGTIYRGRPENVVGSHCPSYNGKSIGICCEGAYMNETMPEAQKTSLIMLCSDIIGRYDINKIYRHGDVYSTDCPGTNFPFEEVVRRAYCDEKIEVINNVKPTILRMGSQGEEVKELQKDLLELGFYLGKFGADGYYGGFTYKVVITIQEIAGISIDGIVGNETKNVIRNFLSKPVLYYGSTGYAVKYLQYKLGVNNDGYFGTDTCNTLKIYQSNCGLDVDGICGNNTWGAIFM